jgi:hypothetical protein
VLLVSSVGDTTGLAEFSAAVSTHRDWARARETGPSVSRQRTRQHVQAFLERRLAGLLQELDPAIWDQAPPEMLAEISKRLPEMLVDPDSEGP